MKRSKRLHCLFVWKHGKWNRISQHAYKLETAQALWQDVALRLMIEGARVQFKPVAQ